MSTYHEVLEFARNKHAGQYRKGCGEPYIEHPKRVSLIVKSNGGSEMMIAAALLHDTLEDTDTTYAELAIHFGLDIADLVQELTSNDEELKRVGKTVYLCNKMLRMSSEALTIKLADRVDNVSDLPKMLKQNPTWTKNYANQTADIMAYLLKNRRSLNDTQVFLITLLQKMTTNYI